MGIWRVKETHKGRSGSLAAGMQREYVRKFDVYTTSRLDGQLEAIFAVDPFTGEAVPELYSSYDSFGVTEVDFFAVCRKISAAQDDDDWQVWHVTCEYATFSPEGSDGQGHPGQGQDPRQRQAGDGVELEPPVVEWGRWAKEMAQTKEPDIHTVGQDGVLRVEPGSAILNSAGQPFDPALTREVGGRVLIVERNQLTYDPAEMEKYGFVMNDDDFLEEGDFESWLCHPPTARRVYKGGFRYWRVRYEFHHAGDLKDWHHHPLDAGFGVLGANNKLVPVMPNGQLSGQPVLLDGKGKQLSRADLLDPKKGPVYLDFFRYDRRPFAPLEIELDD